MRILIVSAVFPPEPVISARTSHDIARELIDRGNEVFVFAPFPNRPSGRIYPGYKQTICYNEKNSSHFKLFRLFSFISHKSTVISRFLENVSFGILSSFALFFIPKMDVIYANTWPIFAQGFLLLASKLRKTPIILSIQDVYPESMIFQGRVSQKGIISKILTWIDKQISNKADHLIVISQKFKDIYQDSRKISCDSITVVPNWITEGLLGLSDPKKICLREKLGISNDKFVIAYGGNIGVAANVETIIESFKYIHPQNKIHAIIAGEGNKLEACQKAARMILPSRISFLSPWPSEQTMSLYESADVLILPTNGDQAVASVPSKLIGYMLSGRPIIALTRKGTDLSDIVEKSGCGWIVEPGCPEKLANTIIEVKNIGKYMLNTVGDAGKRFATNHYLSTICVPNVIAVLDKVVQSNNYGLGGTYHE